MTLGLGRILLGLPCVVLLAFTTTSAAHDSMCNLSKTNNSCTIVIDRQKPIAPSTIQMYSGQRLTVVVRHPLSYERYFLDYTTGAATMAPDVASSIAQGLFPSLGAVTFNAHLYTLQPEVTIPGDPCSDPIVAGQTKPVRGELNSAITPFRGCLADFIKKARDKYQRLEPYVAPDSITPASNGQADLDNDTRESIKDDIDKVIRREFAISANMTTLVGDDSYKAKAKPAIPVDPKDAEAITELTNLQKAADTIAADLLTYSQRLDDLAAFSNQTVACSALGLSSEDEGQCIALTSRSDDPRVYRAMVSRTVTYSLDSLNLVSNSQEAAPDPSKKRALASIAIVFADTSGIRPGGISSAFRWEASAGVFFSTLANRSFSVAPTYNGTTVTDNTVHENIARPTAVPFAAANYRLTDDLGWSRWRSNAYLTMAVGVNPNTKTADFAVGPSIAWRAFMLSALAHWGHETRPTQGFTNGESLGTTFSGSVPTETKWTTAFAIGISVRVPALTGR